MTKNKYMFHAFIWLSEKIQKNFWKKNNCNVQIQSFYFFTEINVIVITQRVKYQKKVPLGTGNRISGTDTGTVLVQMWTVPNPTVRETESSQIP